MTLAPPTDAAQLAAQRELADELPLAVTEQGVAECALGVLARLLPGRALAVRVIDPRGRQFARPYARNATLRTAVHAEAVTLTQVAVDRAKLKQAITASARVRISERWDCPFVGIAKGFAVALAGGGELYGVLDVGYPPGTEPPDSDAVAASMLAGSLALALRNIQLQSDAIGLRDYQARLLDSANALILGIDRQWRITVCNRPLLDLFGKSRPDVLGSDLRDLIAADQQPGFATAFAAALAGRHDAAVTVMVPTRSGPVRCVWSIAAVGRSDGPIDSVIAIGQDQSKIDLLQQQVVRAERLATLGELAAGIVHELNNPLTSITVYAEYLTRKLDTAAVEPTDLEKLRRIGTNAQRILRFSRDLVQYARPSGREVDQVDLAAVVRASVSICEHLIERGGIQLELQIDPALPAIQAVAGQLEQVLINLITNAIHAVEDGGKVVVRAHACSPTAIQLDVADSGHGVRDEDKDRIFEPFFTTKPDGKGTGLGLPIVRNIVEQHRGTIAVHPSDLGGAEFRVMLPIV